MSASRLRVNAVDRANISPLYVFYCASYFLLKPHVLYILFVIFPNLAVRLIFLLASYFESPNRKHYYYSYYYWEVGGGDWYIDYDAGWWP